MSQLVVLLAAGVLALQPQAKACPADPKPFIAMPYETFDQDLAGGWRRFDQDACAGPVADLLRAYRRGHRPLTDRERAVLSWHEGQVRALAGDYAAAIPLMMGGVQDDGGTIDFADYALGTIAFLQGDRPALAAARARLAAVPKPADFQESVTVRQGGRSVEVRVAWPPNLQVLDGLAKCFGKPYRVAYSC